MPSPRTTLALAALLVLAGCTAAPGGATSATPTDVPTPSATPTPTPTTTVVAFETLSPDEQALVRTAIRNGSVTADVTALDTLAPSVDAVLQYDGRRYALEWTHVRSLARYTLSDVVAVNASAVPTNASVVAYADLGGPARTVFDAARSGGDGKGYAADAFPAALRANEYVIRDGQPYRLRVVVADHPVYRLRLTPVE